MSAFNQVSSQFQYSV